jgi:hypothetical protein
MANAATWGDALCVLALEQIYEVTIEAYGLPTKNRLNTPSIAAPSAVAASSAAPSASAAPVARPRRVLVCPAALEWPVPLTLGSSSQNHFDPLVPADQRKTLPEDVTSGAGAPLKRIPWNYCLYEKDRLKLYVPGVCHSQFPVSQALLPKRGALLSAFQKPVTMDSAQVTGRIYLVNLANTPAIWSKQYGDKPADDAFRPEFVAPLVRGRDGRITKELDLDHLRVAFALKARTTTHACFRVYTRNDPKPRLEARLSWDEVEKRKRSLELTLPTVAFAGLAKVVWLKAEDVFPAEQWSQLDAERSPYQLVVLASGKEGEPDLKTAALTYFQVPSEWDIDIVEAAAAERVILLRDDLGGLKPFKGAKIVPRTDEGDAAAKLELTEEERAAVSMALAVAGKDEGYIAHVINALIQRGEGYFAATSWASMIVLKRRTDRPGYYAHSIYYHAQRCACALTKGDVARAPELEPLKAKWGVLVKRISEAWKGATAENTELYRAESDLREAQGALDAEASPESAKKPAAGTKPSGSSAVKTPDVAALEERVAKANERVTRAKEARAKKEAEIEKGLEAEKEELARLRAEAAKRFARGVLPPCATVDGSADFVRSRLSDTKPSEDPGAGLWVWHQVVFKANEFPIDMAVTNGISSCAGGVTFTVNDGPPDVIILWHIDAPPTVPVRAAIQELFPDLSKCPKLRTIASVHPSVWELNKYRKDNLYPRAVQERCETVFLARGAHLFDNYCAIIGGSQYFGLDLRDPKSVTLFFTNEFERAFNERAIDKRTPAGLSVGLLDYGDDLYGDYRFMGEPVDNRERLTAHLDRLEGGSQTLPAVNADTKKGRKLCEMRDLGVSLFDGLRGASTCRRVLDLACFAAGVKGDQQLAGIPWAKHHFWEPGPVGPAALVPARATPASEQYDVKLQEEHDFRAEDHDVKGPEKLPPAALCHNCMTNPPRANAACAGVCPALLLCAGCADSLKKNGSVCPNCRNPMKITDSRDGRPW